MLGLQIGMTVVNSPFRSKSRRNTHTRQASNARDSSVVPSREEGAAVASPLLPILERRASISSSVSSKDARSICIPVRAPRKSPITFLKKSTHVHRCGHSWPVNVTLVSLRIKKAGGGSPRVCPHMSTYVTTSGDRSPASLLNRASVM